MAVPVRMRAPDGACGFSVGGVEYPLDVEGCFTVDDRWLADCLRAGCVAVGARETLGASDEDDASARQARKRR